MKRKHLFLSLLVLFLSIAEMNAQEQLFVIEGTVMDKEADMPLPYANVFLANTTYGVASDNEGKFRLEVPQKGPFLLVIRYVGYLPFKQQVTLTEGEVFKVDVKLEVDIRQETVVVTGYRSATYYEKGDNKVYTRGSEWKKYLRHFEKNFLGTSEYGRNCKILNPEVLEFEINEEEESFKALASAPLQIENRSLGYRIDYTLERFDLSFNKMTSQYAGYPFFEELEPKNDKQRLRWKRNRWRAYRGSLRHFLTAAYHDEIKEKAFDAVTFNVEGYLNHQKSRYEVTLLTKDFYTTFEANDFLYSKDFPGAKSFRFSDILLVTDGSNIEASNYIRPRQHHMFFEMDPQLSRRYLQRSWIQLKPGKAIEVASNGYVYNPLDFTVFGYWAYERVGELLPYYFDQLSMNDQ